MSRALVGRPVNLSHQFLDLDGATVPASAVTVTVTDWTGAQVATGSATDDGSGNWTFPLEQQPLGVYGVVWDADNGTMTDTTQFEVVGGVLFTVPDARATEYLSDSGLYPTADIASARDAVTAEFERITGRSFVERVRVVSFAADGGSPVLLSAIVPDAAEVVGAVVNGVPVADVSGWRVTRLGRVTADTNFCDGDVVTVAIRHGFGTVPDDVKRVAIIRCSNVIAEGDSNIPDRATTWQPAEGGTFRLATPGKGGSETGIPEVDATLSRYSLDVVLSAAGVVL